MQSALNAPHLRNEEAAIAYVESWLWPNGPVCPHCAAVDEATKLKGKSTRPGLWKCRACRKPFTVRMRTIFESSHVPLHVWLQAIYLICSSKKGISTRQIQRTLECSMKTAWFLMHRIRLAMDGSSGTGPLGGPGKSVEVDETFITKSPKSRRAPGERADVQVMGLVERGGPLRSVFLDHKTVRSAMYRHIAPDTRLLTDGANWYKGFAFASIHESVDHSKEEWVRGDVHTNTLEGFFSVFKRGLVGVYQHMSEAHLHRYLAEFDFRRNHRERLGIDDKTRADRALVGAKGKRLTYETARSPRTEEPPF
jgi:transposase-like protein